MGCPFLCYDRVKILETLYEPACYSDEQMLEWGREAMREAKKNNRIDGGYIYTGQASNGMWFVGYINLQTGEITNYHPIILESKR